MSVSKTSWFEMRIDPHTKAQAEQLFYSCGLTWAHYYASTSDGMHFALTEYVTHDHQGEFGLRKVFDYISEEQ